MGPKLALRPAPRGAGARRARVLLALGIAALPAGPAGACGLAGAVTDVGSLVAASGAQVAVAFRTLDGGAEFRLRAGEPFHAASTMKVAVLIELYHQAHAGELRLSDRLTVRNAFTSLVDGTSYRLEPEDDSETTLYAAVGETRTLAELAELMITVSSNLATNLLIEKLGVERIRATTRALGADGMDVRRGLEDKKAYRAGINNTTTAGALLVLMEALATGRAVDPAASREMVAILERQAFNEDIPAGLPPGIRVAHKTGEIPQIEHDAAIVYARRPFVLVVLTRGLDPPASSALIAAIARRLYDAVE